MKRLILLLFLLQVSIVCGQENSQSGRRIMLPSPSLMKCDSAQLWLDEKPEAEAVYPVWVHMDHFDEKGCPHGMMAIYDQTVSIDEIKASLDVRYGRWFMTGLERPTIKLWRVEPEKFAINLSTIEKSPKRKCMREMGGEKGMKLVIYLAFIPRAPSHAKP